LRTEPLDPIPLWVFFLLTCLWCWAALALGIWTGRDRIRHAAGEKEGPIGAVVGAILALLAFMLAFTFSLAATRFDSRREAVLEEANAIGAGYRRAEMLPNPERDVVRRLLREYVDIRVSVIQSNSSEAPLVQALARSEELHRALWDQAVQAAAKAPNDITGLFVESLNSIFELHAKRLQVSIRGRVPLIIWIALFSLTGIGMASVGYLAGIAASRQSPAMLALILGFAGTVYLIADLDRPAEGMVRTSQTALIDLQKQMRTDLAAN
jgi:hypothetical protein